MRLAVIEVASQVMPIRGSPTLIERGTALSIRRSPRRIQFNLSFPPFSGMAVRTVIGEVRGSLERWGERPTGTA
jgi:hypothetical protein